MTKAQNNLIAVIGAGTWGITLACLLAGKGNKVRVWDIDREWLKRLEREQRHFRLPELKFPEGIEIKYELNDVVENADFVVLAVPSRAFRQCCLAIERTGLITPSQILIICTKGIEPESCLTMSAVAQEVLGKNFRESICVVSGPSHAEEVALQMPTVVVAAAYEDEVAQKVQQLFMTNYFRLYRQADILGVELGGAIKNVIAIAAGICDGLGYGDNTKAALLTRGLAEMIRLGVTLGGKIETFTGLSGVGDLIVTATSRYSRNRNFGEALAHGLSIEEAKEKIGMVIEGVTTVISVKQLAEKHNVSMPISQEVYAVLYEGKSPRQAAIDLMLREPKPEIYR